MVKGYKDIISNYFKDHSFVNSNIKSFDDFLDNGLIKLIEEVGDIVPTIIPQEYENFKIKFGKISVGKPQIVEADGSIRDLYPIEARLRQLTYSAPIFLEVSAYIDGVQRESFTSQICKIPIMLKSKHCHLHEINKEELVKHGEDANDPGGYFVLNGNERTLITVEDLASNKLFVKKTTIGPSEFTGKLFSERFSYRIPHLIEQMKDGIISMSFSRFNRIPVVAVIKALGLISDKEIMESISFDKKVADKILVNLYQNVELKTQEDALEYLAKHIGITHRELRFERIQDQLDKYLLPHIGTTSKDRKNKAYNLCKLVKRFLMVVSGEIKSQNQDHYSNKRLKLAGDLLFNLFRINIKSLVQDILYNFQRLVKRGKFSSVRIIIREHLLTQRIKSAIATGSWPGGRKGISQNLSRTNAIDMISHLQRVVSLLTSTQENFAARALHSTHWGRLCPVETPEGTPIGLRKNLALLSNISMEEIPEDKIKKYLEGIGLKQLD
jgi:DNA-directed RNA polymerase subunit B